MAFLKQDEVKGNGQRTKKPKPVEAKPAQPEPKRARTGGPSDYGRFYWCVKTSLSEDGEIYVFANEVQFTPIGGVTFLGPEGRANLGLAPGQWSSVYAASCFDGSAVAVEHWKGEVQR